MILETKIAMIAVVLIFVTREYTISRITGSKAMVMSRIINLLLILNVFIT